MIDDKAKETAQARAELGQALALCAAVMAQSGKAITASSAALTQAIERERVATESYITELEKQVSGQRSLS